MCTFNNTKTMTWVFHRVTVDVPCLLGCCSTHLGDLLPKFLRNLPSSFSGLWVNSRTYHTRSYSISCLLDFDRYRHPENVLHLYCHASTISESSTQQLQSSGMRNVSKVVLCWNMALNISLWSVTHCRHCSSTLFCLEETDISLYLVSYIRG
jgi:hypothetical protein